MFTAETSAPTTPPSNQDDNRARYPFRLLADETVLGTFPVARTSRPLGKVASFLFVTDSRVLYSAEAKALGSSSTHLKEYQVQTITGVDVGRRRGLSAIGAAAAAGTAVNFLILVTLASVSSSSYQFEDFSPVFGILAAFSLIVGAIAVLILSGSRTEIHLIGTGEAKTLAGGQDIAGLIVAFLLLLIFGPLVGIAGILWAVLRELGMFKATDAELYVDSKNVDYISYEVGALILDVQARGKFAGQN